MREAVLTDVKYVHERESSSGAWKGYPVSIRHTWQIDVDTCVLGTVSRGMQLVCMLGLITDKR